MENHKEKYLIHFGQSFAYEFSEEGLDRIQILINELRDLISDSNTIDENHKLRLLKRLENLQLELHKRVSNLDRFWGFVGDAGVVLGKFGKDVKPIVDRIREMLGIVWRTQAKSEELESNAENLLLNPKDSEN